MVNKSTPTRTTTQHRLVRSDDDDSKPEATTKSTVKVKITINIPKGREANNADLLYKASWTPEEVVQGDCPESPAKAKDEQS